MFVGYDAMGYEMSKPHLRAELEADLKRYSLLKIDLKSLKLIDTMDAISDRLV